MLEIWDLVEGTLVARSFSRYTNTALVLNYLFGFHPAELVESLRTAREVPRSIPVRDKHSLPRSKILLPVGENPTNGNGRY